VNAREAEIREVVPGLWIPDPWRRPSGQLRALACEGCGTILGRQLADPNPASMAAPVPYETALRLELVPLGSGPSGLPRYGLPKAEMAGKRTRGSHRAELVMIGDGTTRFYHPAMGESDSMPMRFETEPGQRVLLGVALTVVSRSQRLRARKRLERAWTREGVETLPAVPFKYVWRRAWPRRADGFPGAPSVAFMVLVTTPCEVFCLNPQCGGWHRLP
jgi:hypothetical protein